MPLNDFLRELKQYWIQNDIPNITLTNAIFLRNLIKIQNTKNMLEIGTANGYSSIHFALELQKTWWKLTTIEFSSNSRDQALENFKQAKVNEIITSHLGNALDILPTLQESYDFVFIDGMKKRSKVFLELIWDKVPQNGIIIIDDVIKFRHKMQDLYEHLEDQKIPHNIIPIDGDDGIMMILKE